MSISFSFLLPFFIIKLLVDKVCKRGDGIGGTETYYGSGQSSLDECVQKVMAYYPNANGASFKDCNGASDCNGNCFAEFEMDDWNDNQLFMSCLFAGKIFS